ncbi:MAG: hypothetical protein IMX02_02715 [Limnochordaceae bacterium]|nr:hypothetical protein [Limnochordaceae bacterium]
MGTPAKWWRRWPVLAAVGWTMTVLWAMGGQAQQPVTPAPSPAILPPANPVAYVRIATEVLSGVQALAEVDAGGGLLAIGWRDRVEVGRFTSDYRWVESFKLGLPSGVTALTVASLERTGQPDLVVGSGGAGSLTVIRAIASERPVVVPVSGYLFGEARQVVAAELDGPPPLEILALNGNDELFLFSAAAGGGYRRLWRSKPGVRVRAVAAGDLDGDGIAEVVTGEQGGALRVYRWRGALGLQAVAESYPWGAVTALTVVPAPDGSSSARIVAVTDRSLVYAYRWDAGSLVVAQRAFDPDQRLRLRWVRGSVVGPLPAGTAAPLVLEGAGPSGLQMVRVVGDQLSWIASATWVGASPGFVRRPTRELLVVRPGGQLDVLSQVSPNFLVISVDGREMGLGPGIHVQWSGDLPLVDVTQLGQFVPVSVMHEPASRHAVLQAGTSVVRLYADLPLAHGDRSSVDLPVAPEFDAARGILYAPFEVLRPLGWAVAYDIARRRLTLRSPWPVAGG